MEEAGSAMWSNYGYSPGMMGYEGGYWWMGLHGLMFLIVTALLVVGIVLAIRHLARTEGRPTQTAPSDSGRQSALGILDSRYARGEVDREEYLQKKQDLL